jgi:hypothetical protein
MSKYKKKPIVIEAEQFFINKYPYSCPEGVFIAGYRENYGTIYKITTLEGDMCLSDGDWIITGIKGEKYPCKDEIFKLTYDLVEEL